MHNPSSNTPSAAYTAETLAILRLLQVRAISGQSQSGLYAACANGLYTKPVKISARAAGWPASEVIALNKARIAGHSEDQIRELVKQLTAARAELA